MDTLTPTEFRALLDTDTQIVDVRQPGEVEIAAIAGAINLPLDRLPALIGSLNPQRPVAVLCHHGVRSEMAARYLEQQGFTQVCHLGGGIDAWSCEVDGSVPRY